MSLIPYSLTILSSLVGFFLAVYIFRKKQIKKPLICPLKANCEMVIHSRFSVFFGVPLEIWGMLYYLTIIIGYVFFLVFGGGFNYPTLTFFFLTITIFAFVFSVYLTFIQAFVIHEWCTWCLASAGLSTIIFLIATVGADYSLTAILAAHFQIILTANVFMLALGLGSATFYGLFFIRFLRDLKISQLEYETLRLISQVTWLAIFILIISGLGLWPQINDIADPNHFAIGIIILAVIILNELIASLWAGPRLIDISFGKRHPHHPGELRRLRQLLFILVMVSLLSWYALLAIFLLPKETAAPLFVLIAVYIALVGIGFVAGFIADNIANRLGNEKY